MKLTPYLTENIRELFQAGNLKINHSGQLDKSRIQTHKCTPTFFFVYATFLEAVQSFVRQYNILSSLVENCFVFCPSQSSDMNI